MPTLWAASLRHLLRHRAQLALALVGLSVGVATLIAVDIATASSRRAFELSMRAVNGAATHQIVAGPQGIDEQLYVGLRTHPSQPAVALAPIAEGYVNIGARTFELVGIDPFASPELEGNDAPGSLRARSAEAGDHPVLDPVGGQPASWFLPGGGVIMAASTAATLGLGTKRSFELETDGKKYTARLVGTVGNGQPGYDALVLTDIAQAQEWLGTVGRLSRIDVRVPDGAAGQTALTLLRERLPEGVQLLEARGRARQSIEMTSAFTTNLQAMSLLALLVSTLLIYGAVSFAVVQRRRIIGILRALGATRGEVLAIVLTEAAVLGAVGSGIGLALGAAIGHGLVELVSRTINDLYYVVAVNATTLPVSSVFKALCAGFGTALLGALLPALEVAGSAPQLGLRRSVLEGRAVALARRLLIAGAALAVTSAVIALTSGRSLFAGFVALTMLLLSVAAFTPAVLRTLSQAAARVLGDASPIARLAFGDIAASLSRTGVAVAALGMAVAAMIGVSIMVESFRQSLRDWLASTMRADIYVTAPGAGAGRPERRIDAEVLSRLLATPGLADYGASRRAVLDLPGGAVSVDAVKLARATAGGITLTAGDPNSAWPAFEKGDVVISEPLAYRLQLELGNQLTLPTGSGPRAFRIAGIYREYGNDRGTVMISLSEYRRLWQDESITGLGFYLAEGVQLDEAMRALRNAAQGRQALLIRSNAQLRAVSMMIFERTFVITRVLYWLAAGVAAIGLISALLAWELERTRELAILRSLGLTPRATAVLIEAQTGFMGLVALLAAIPAGLVTAVLLIDVINRRAFGWQIDLHLTAAQFANALLLSLAAACAAGLYPAWRMARAATASDIREE